MRIVFMIPVHNERANVGFVLDDLTAHYPAATLLVVDDGSTDGTADVAREKAATVIKLPFNLGIGNEAELECHYAASSYI